MQYLNGLATVTLYDTVTSNSFSTNAPVNVPSLVHGNQAYVGFTAADGGVLSTQTVSNFVYTSLIDLSVAQNGVNSLAVTWPVGVGGYVLQQDASLGDTNWVAVTNAVSVVSGSNQVTVPLTSSNAFYRLVNP
ncbi:MAG TPA: hypothetical protein VG754_09240 [Verrucomicrobiae bacterium]|nr:hypothetical protein [Verrucomicrobiae bacterium]